MEDKRMFEKTKGTIMKGKSRN